MVKFGVGGGEKILGMRRFKVKGVFGWKVDEKLGGRGWRVGCLNVMKNWRKGLLVEGNKMMMGLVIWVLWREGRR